MIALHSAYAASLLPAWLRFASAADDPERAQRRRLSAVLASAAPSAYGRSLGLSATFSVAEFRRRAPVVDHAALAPYVSRVAAGERGVLTAEPVRMLERTSGTTRANKLIPYTDGLRSDFAAAVDAWLFDLHRAFPRLVGTRSYWSVSPAARRGERTEGGVPIGFDDDTAYFGPLTRWALARLLAVPASVARLPDLDAWRRSTCRYLLAADDLGFISVWSPSFLTALMEAIAGDLDALLAELPAARRDAVKQRLDVAGALTGEALWPRLVAVSSWTEGFAAELLPALRRWFPTVAIQPKGLLATEGVVSFPLVGAHGAALALDSHFLEFADLESPSAEPLLAHELRPGARYAPILTTRGGFLRYQLGDVVRCVGRWRRCPLVRFEGRRDRVSDLCGEKLAEAVVVRAVAAARAELPCRFVLVAPALAPSAHYAAYVDTDAPDEALERARVTLEAALSEGAHYRYCRALGQLGPVSVRRVRAGMAAYHDELVRRGARLGDVKPSSFDTRPIWEEVFRA